MHQSIHLIILRGLLLMVVLLNLDACGFHPRGQANAPAPHLSPILVSGLPNHHALYRDLAYQLQLAGVELTKDQRAAATILKIHKQKTERHVLSVDSRNKTVEYEIEESLDYSVQRPPGTPVGEHRSLRATRILFNSGIQILGRDREETLLRKDMYQQLSRLLINQLASIR